MLGYHTFRYKLLALALSGLLAGAAGAAYALMFGYVGATFASIEYSIYALLWVLLGGSGHHPGADRRRPADVLPGRMDRRSDGRATASWSARRWCC